MNKKTCKKKYYAEDCYECDDMATCLDINKPPLQPSKEECKHEWETIAFIGINGKEIGECSKCGMTYEGKQPSKEECKKKTYDEKCYDCKDMVKGLASINN